jgi:hypothetical protein
LKLIQKTSSEVFGIFMNLPRFYVHNSLIAA